jgi:hypothetical protein
MSVGLLSSAAWAASPLDVDFSRQPTDEAYAVLTTALLSPTRFAFIAPATATGLGGFDLGVAATTIRLPESARKVFETRISNGKSLPTTLYLPRLVVQKGLPLGFDLGANILMLPGTAARLFGGGIQYQLDLPLPAFPLRAAVRAGYNAVLGLPELDSSQMNLEAVTSAGLPPGISTIVDLEPYAGYGIAYANADSRARYRLDGSYERRTFANDWKESYLIAGARLSVTTFRLVGEAQFSTIGLPTVFSAKIGIGF